MEEEEVMALSSAGTLGQVCSLQIKLIISILLEKRDIDISIILGSLYREKYEPVVLGQDPLSDDEGQKTPHGNALVAPTIKPTITPKLEIRA